jgi:hypothetical protein
LIKPLRQRERQRQTKQNREVPGEEDISEEKEVVEEAICGITDPQGHPSFSNIK